MTWKQRPGCGSAKGRGGDSPGPFGSLRCRLPEAPTFQKWAAFQKFLSHLFGTNVTFQKVPGFPGPPAMGFLGSQWAPSPVCPCLQLPQLWNDASLPCPPAHETPWGGGTIKHRRGWGWRMGTWERGGPQQGNTGNFLQMPASPLLSFLLPSPVGSSQGTPPGSVGMNPGSQLEVDPGFPGLCVLGLPGSLAALRKHFQGPGYVPRHLQAPQPTLGYVRGIPGNSEPQRSLTRRGKPCSCPGLFSGAGQVGPTGRA